MHCCVRVAVLYANIREHWPKWLFCFPPKFEEANQHMTPMTEGASITAPPAPAPLDASAAATPEAQVASIIDSLDSSKAEDIVTLNIVGKSALADYIVVASGRSNRHVGAISDHLLRDLKQRGFGTAKVEGLPHCDWVLIDAGDVLVHIFRPEVRQFYSIEKMWADTSASQ